MEGESHSYVHNDDIFYVDRIMALSFYVHDYER